MAGDMKRRWIWGTLGAIALLLLVAGGAALWLLRTPEGARFALNQAIRAAGEGVRYEGLEGSLADVLRVRLIEVSRPDLYARIEDVTLEASPLQPLRGVIHVKRLLARSVEVRTVDTGAAARLPVSFAPPQTVRLDEGRIERLRLGDLTREAAAERDIARKRALIEASRAHDIVIEQLLLRGEGDHREWRVAEAGASTAYGRIGLNGRVQSAAPFRVDARAALEGQAGERPYRASLQATGTLKSLTTEVAGELSGQAATGRAVIEPFATVPVRSLELRARDLDLSRFIEGPRTRLAIEAKLAGEKKAFAGLVEIVNAEAGPWDRQRLPVTSARSRVVVSAEQVELANLDVTLAGGGAARGHALLRKAGAQANLVLSGVDLAALHGALQPTKVGGRLSVEGDSAAQRFDVALQGAPAGRAASIPRFEVLGRARLAGERLDVEDATIRTGGGAVTGKGHIAFSGRKEFRFDGRAEHFDPSAFVSTSTGDLNFTFATRGTLAPEIAAEVRAEIAPSTYAGLPASGRVDVAGDKRRIARADVNVALGDSRLTARGAFGGRGDTLDVTLRSPDLSVLARPFKVKLAGRLDADARLTGTFSSPAGRVQATGANLTLPGDVYAREMTLRAQAGVEPTSPIDAALQVAGVALGKETPPTPFAEKIEASIKGTRVEHRLEATAVMTRETTLRTALAGGLDERAKEPSWKGRIEGLSMTGRGAFALAAPTPLEASPSRVEVGESLLRGEWGEARVQVARWTPRTLDLKGSTPGIEIQNLARSLRLGTLPRSNLVIAGDWDIRSAETFNGTLNLHRVRGDLLVGEPPFALGLRTLEVKAEAVRGRARASVVVDGERSGRIQGEGSAMLARGTTGWEFARDAPVQARLAAEHTNLELLSPWLGTDAKLGGRLQANVSVSGTGADPVVAGEARATQLVVREPQSGFEAEQGELVARLNGKSLTLERFEAATPWRPAPAARERFATVAIPEAGRISASGTIDLRGRSGGLRVKAQQAVLTQTTSRFLAVTGEARLEAGDKGMVAAGDLKADAGWIGALESAPPSPSDDVVVVRASSGAPREAKEAGAESLRVDARFSLGEHMFFVGRGLDTRLTGDIRVSGPPTALRGFGTIRTAGGTYNGYGQKLVVDRGVLHFAGPIDNPQLSVLALRKGLPVEAGVEVLGSVRRPQVRLVSYPDVPEPEKLSWLVLGRGPSELGPGDASVLLSAATSMLGKNNPGSDLGKRLGLDEVKLGRADTNSILGVLPQSTVAGKTGSPSAAQVVTVGKKLTKNLQLSYEQGLGDAEGALKLAWQITQQFQVLARAGYLPGLDAVYRWSFK